MTLCEKCEVRWPGKPGETSIACPVAPADEEKKDQEVLDVEELEHELEADQVMFEIARRYLCEEARSLHHQLRHKPKNPYCDTCTRAKFRLVRNMKGSFKQDVELWGQPVTGDHVVTMSDLGKGVDGGQ